jgi:acyl-CoA thioesterase-1
MLVLAVAPIAASVQAEPRIVVLGDSLTAGYGLEVADSFPAQLEAALRAAGLAAQVLNAGVSGDTTAGGLARLAWVLGESPERLPSHVIIALGANDAMRGLEPSAAAANLSAIVTELKARRVKVLLAGMRAPPNLGARYVAEFDAIYPRLAAAHQVPLYPFFLDGVGGEPGLNQPDGIHPTAAGVAEMVRRILPTLRAWLADEAPP